MTDDRAYDILTFGDMCVDLIVSGGDIVPHFGQAEQLVECYELEMGGSCCIFACQAAKLGLRVAVLGKVGDDDFGRLAVRRLQECGVDTQHVHVDPSVKTGLGIALCREDDRAILTYEGSIAALRPEDVSDSLLASARHLHYGSFFLHTGLRPHAPAILQQARALGLTTSIDPNWDPEERWSLTLGPALPYADLVFPNEQEALRIARSTDIEHAAAWFQAQGVRLVAVKQGTDGAVVYDAQYRHTCTVKPAPLCGDGVGAGDSFDAGFLASWLRGAPVQECLAIGCRCGRAVASAVGGLRGQPMWAEIAPPSSNQWTEETTRWQN